ncbi:PRC-barrel domain-containing protein [Tianweitania sp.]|uniref:PRC-barrel domain-containing protein n=1 Tax=Tianweitania sp. TaxID=2021634 RepID=UPI00289F6881|nr:PRC-barrel domain-containing protein [Tianweitania sp.]
MIRKLLATTAIASVIATGAFAQSGTTTAPAATDAPATTSTPPTPDQANVQVNTAVVPADGQLASNLIGETVYNGTGDDAENIGNVNDLILSDSGQIESVIVGVGGFLGIGEKNVALSYSDIDWAEKDGDRWIVLATTADALKQLPAFDRRAYDPANANAANGGGTATTATGTSGTAMAPASGTATTTTAPAATTDTAANDTAAVDRATLKEVPAADLTSENLEGTTVYGAEDANVGDIGDVVLTQDGKVDAIIIDVGGFLGIGEKQVAVGFDNLKFLQDEDGDRYLYTTFTKEQLEAQPEYDEGTWAAQRDQQRLTTK